jgi:hypothetical protein
LKAGKEKSTAKYAKGAKENQTPSPQGAQRTQGTQEKQEKVGVFERNSGSPHGDF